MTLKEMAFVAGIFGLYNHICFPKITDCCETEITRAKNEIIIVFEEYKQFHICPNREIIAKYIIDERGAKTLSIQITNKNQHQTKYLDYGADGTVETLTTQEGELKREKNRALFAVKIDSEFQQYKDMINFDLIMAQEKNSPNEKLEEILDESEE